MIEVRTAPADSPEAVILMRELSKTLLSVTGRSGEASFQPEDMAAPRNVFAVAYRSGAPAGCGAIREISPDTCELKRMYARDRGVGVGARDPSLSGTGSREAELCPDHPGDGHG